MSESQTNHVEAILELLDPAARAPKKPLDGEDGEGAGWMEDPLVKEDVVTGEPLMVIQFSGAEYLSQLFWFEVTVAVKRQLSLAELVKKQCRLTLERVQQDNGKTSAKNTLRPEDGKTPAKKKRYIHGRVCKLQRVRRDVSAERTIYRLTLVPEVWPLTRRTDCRIFQGMDVKQVVEQVLGSTLWASTIISSRRRLVPRDYCVQYMESDWDFISRLLEDEGFHYHIDHERAGPVLLISDSHKLPFSVDASNADPPGNEPAGMVVFQPISGQQTADEQVYELTLESEVLPSQVHLDDYLFHIQRSAVTSQHSASSGASPAATMARTSGKALEHYIYPSVYQPQETADDRHLKQTDRLIKGIAEVRLQEARCEAEVGEGKSTCIRFAPGRHFTIEEEKDSKKKKGQDNDLEGRSFLLTAVFHEGSIPGDKAVNKDGTPVSRMSYSNSFRCIPRGTPFRPSCRTPKPTIQGVQTAQVVGPPDQEIHTDKYGRVKVQFRWDREAWLETPEREPKKADQHSCWIRVSQLWAGQGWGAMWIPRVGHEVLVSFEEGNPDRPIITGRVYNPVNMPPYTLPRQATRSTIKSDSTPRSNGFNELRFEDRRGAEQIYIHAQRNQDEVVGNDHTTTVRRHQTITVQEGDQKVTVNEGQRELYVRMDHDERVGQHHSQTVAENQTIDIGHDQSLLVGHDQSLLVGHDQSLSVGNDQSLSVGKNRTVVLQDGNQTTLIHGDHTEMTLFDRQVEVKSGKHQTQILAGDRIASIIGNDSHDMTGNYKLTVGGDLTITAGGKISISSDNGSIVIDVRGITIETDHLVDIKGKEEVDLNC